MSHFWGALHTAPLGQGDRGLGFYKHTAPLGQGDRGLGFYKHTAPLGQGDRELLFRSYGLKSQDSRHLFLIS